MSYKIERIDTPNGRFYKVPNGNIYPSVTTVISVLPTPELDQWREAIGEEQAQKISLRATQCGTKLHTFCENYLLGNKPKLDPFDRDAYRGLTNHLDKIEHISIEEMLWSDALKVAGTLDCLGYYDGKLSIIDFKTTSALKHDGEFDSYWLQTAAYAHMVYERRGLIVPNLRLIMQCLTDGECHTYHQRTCDWLPKFKNLRSKFTTIPPQ
jgi:hypothetical protein